jgi:hypothetical protein
MSKKGRNKTTVLEKKGKASFLETAKIKLFTHSTQVPVAVFVLKSGFCVLIILKLKVHKYAPLCILIRTYYPISVNNKVFILIGNWVQLCKKKT